MNILSLAIVYCLQLQPAICLERVTILDRQSGVLREIPAHHFMFRLLYAQKMPERRT